VRHALVLGQRVRENDEGLLLFHAAKLADTGRYIQARIGYVLSI
jgi:hypothetical protein